jgi:hypothetical protein
MNGDMGQGNLAGELISEMQQTNPPGVFNVDNGGTQPMMGAGQMQMGQVPMGQGPMGQGPMGQGQMGPMGQGPMGQGQSDGQNVQINPQLQQQFMFVLQQDVQLQQKFADPQVLQQALQNPNVMMNTIAFFQQQLQARQQVPQQQPIQQQQQSQSPPQPEPDDDDADTDEDDKVQYDDKIDDIDLMSSSKQSWMDKILNNLKEPLLMTVIFVILLQPFVRDYLIKFIPKIQDSPILQTAALAAVFLIGTFSLKIFMNFALAR